MLSVMTRNPSFPKVSFEFKPRDADSTFIAGMILFLFLGVIFLFINGWIAIICFLIGFIFIAILLYALFGNQNN